MKYIKKGDRYMKKVLGGKSKACHFCGGEMYIILIGNKKYVQCKKCGALTKNIPIYETRIWEG